MKRSNIIKTLCLILAILISVISVGCGAGNGGAESSATSESMPTTENGGETVNTETSESSTTTETETTSTESNETNDTEPESTEISESTSSETESSDTEESESESENEDTVDIEDQYVYIDVAKEASSATLNREIIQKQMNDFAAEGFKKVIILPTPDTYAVTDSCQGSVLCDPSVSTDHMHASVHSTLDPTLSYILAAKNAGLKVTVIYRPYESGGGITIPENATAQFSFGERVTIGGKSVFCSSEFGNSDNKYIASRDYANGITETRAPATLEVVFAAEGFTNGDKAVTVDAAAEIVPTLWTSDENFNYKKADGIDFDVSEETRVITDANGNIIGEIKCRVLRIDLSDVSESNYFALSFENGNALYTVPFSQINCYDADGNVISTTKAIFARNPYSDKLMGCDTVPSDYFWGSERKPIITSDASAIDSFKAFGFEFQYGGIGADEGDGWQNGYVYGIAIGAKSHLAGNLCEAIVDVRTYWLGQIDRYYAKGADEVIIGLENHGGMVYDYTNYGFNREIVDEYKRLYGGNILEDDFDYLNLMRVRGEFFVRFLKEARVIARSRGGLLGIELKDAFEAPSLDESINGLCHYKMPKILFDWEKALSVCDSVLITDRVYGEYDADLADEIRDKAQKLGAEVIVALYEAYGADENTVADALGDKNNDAIVLIK